jgi:predicted small secreted protein
MTRSLAALLIAVFALISGCGEPVRGVNEDAKAAKAQAHEAADAAAEAARRIDALSRAPVEEAAGAH